MNMTPFLRHFHDVLDVTSCLLNYSIINQGGLFMRGLRHYPIIKCLILASLKTQYTNGKKTRLISSSLDRTSSVNISYLL